ncbi:LapA family protein [Novosphingobium colocasiae]|uniref:Lipopolysaccharide assembly protein A domain-containing protein n=1 Tax=Novosphingobium colocasiae TaxID=1256513 RepID=A0A918PE22_9SPHN|nr:LapA family protein [Novosphingobium colocasiae]GGZ02181.1 hypothetical protein GCM10011614_16470 [Novosphingobium colocasiae]
MQVIRTIGWVVLTAILVGFLVMNWGPGVPVNFWIKPSGEAGGFLWPVGVVALAFLLLGAVPMWLYQRALRWRLTRRISSLENSLRALSMPATDAPVVPTDPVATQTPLENP